MNATREETILEIHGYVGCAFAWRVRLAAAEKKLPFAWIPCDVATPDPRAAAHNPHEHSPLLHHAGFSLLESEVIACYLDESFAGRALWPDNHEERALLRMLNLKVRAIDVHTEPSRPEARRRSAPALALLESALSTGELGEDRFLPKGPRPTHLTPRDYLHGESPGFVDLMIWPFLFHSAARGLIDAAAFPAVSRYLARAAARPSYEATRPPWAPAA